MKSPATPAKTSPCVTPCEGADFVVLFSCSDALAVGHNEDALALMRRASFSRREEANRRREVHVSYLSQHGFKTEGKVSRDVLEEEPFKAWPEFSRNSCNIGPEVPLVVGSLALSSVAERLAGVSGKQGVDASREGPGVECGEIIPYWCGSEVSGPLPCDNDGSGVFLPLNPTPGVKSGFGQHEAHIQASAAGAEGESVSGT